jgi:hypothetical protein
MEVPLRSGRIGILCPAELVDEGAGLAGRCQGALFAGSIGGALRGGFSAGCLVDALRVMIGPGRP